MLQKLTKLLQSGFSKSILENSDRGGWKISSNKEVEFSRQEKNGSVREVRVESIEILELGSREYECIRGNESSVSVYNIEVVDNHNYFANNILVSNCHYLKGMSRRFFSFFGKKKKSKSGKETFESLVEKAKDIYLLTGTPVNKPLDFYNLLRICNHPVSRNYTFYSNRYCGPQKNAFGTAYKGASNLKELHKKIQNVMHRRTKEECLDLPEKTRRVIPLQVSQKAIEKFYEDFLTEKKRDKKIGVSHIAKFMKFSQAIGIEKAKQGIHIAEDIIENDGKVVIFTNFTDVVKIYEEHFKNRCVKIVGGMSDDERKKAVKRFQEGDAEVFIGNIKAAGVGLTLTKSCHTLVNDLSCVVTEHLQAEDRIHRISQTRNVTISYLSARGTMEADVMRILLNKLDNASIVLDGVKAVNNNILADLYKILERESK